MLNSNHSPLRVLFAAYRHDPRDMNAASGSDYNFYHSMVKAGMDVKVIGPFREVEAVAFERAIRRLDNRMSGRRYAKFPISSTWHVSRALTKATNRLRPDVVFSMFPNFFTFYAGKAPFVYRLDTCFIGWQRNYPEFSRLAMTISICQEQRTFQRASRIITQSDWTKRILVDEYGVSEEKIIVFANPSALPEYVELPDSSTIQFSKELSYPIRLLLVGRDYHRKGVDQAIEIVERLNALGIESNLIICGVNGSDRAKVKFVGTYRKTNPEQLLKYVNLYKNAHFLLHPAIFEAAGIVPSEAAAFGTPTITNDTGGLGTTVQHNISGCVLPKWSSTQAYVTAVQELISNPHRYYELCLSTRARYDRELNWDIARNHVTRTLLDASAMN